MAYNVLSGTVGSATDTSKTVYGTFVGDGANLVDTPGPNAVVADTADDNRLITFTSTAGTTIRGEANLTFDGSTLTVDPGNITASVGITGSAIKVDGVVSGGFFHGDGSNLINVPGGGGGSGNGIFTEINGSTAYTTSSVKIGASGTPAANLHVSGNYSTAAAYLSGGVRFRRCAVTDHYTASAGDYFLGVDSAAGAISISLNATQFADGQTLVIKDETGNASTNSITLTAAIAQKIDVNQRSVIIESPFGAVSLYTDNNNWFVY